MGSTFALVGAPDEAYVWVVVVSGPSVDELGTGVDEQDGSQDENSKKAKSIQLLTLLHSISLYHIQHIIETVLYAIYGKNLFMVVERNLQFEGSHFGRYPVFSLSDRSFIYL